MTWAESFLNALKANDVRLVTYVPDNVLTPPIKDAGARQILHLEPAPRARTRRSARWPAPGWRACAAAARIPRQVISVYSEP